MVALATTAVAQDKAPATETATRKVVDEVATTEAAQGKAPATETATRKVLERELRKQVVQTTPTIPIATSVSAKRSISQ